MIFIYDFPVHTYDLFSQGKQIRVPASGDPARPVARGLQLRRRCKMEGTLVCEVTQREWRGALPRLQRLAGWRSQTRHAIAADPIAAFCRCTSMCGVISPLVYVTCRQRWGSTSIERSRVLCPASVSFSSAVGRAWWARHGCSSASASHPRGKSSI